MGCTPKTAAADSAGPGVEDNVTDSGEVVFCVLDLLFPL